MDATTGDSATAGDGGPAASIRASDAGLPKHTSRLQCARARSWSICAFPASSQPPTVIFYVRSTTTRAANRAPQQGLGVQQCPEPHCQAAHAAVGRARAVADGNGIWSLPNLRLNHLSSSICQWSGLLANSGARSHYGKRALGGDAMCGQASVSTATVKTVPRPAEEASSSGELVVRRAGEVNYRSRKITGAAAEGFATPG
jgi:hypothetical protein